MPANIQPRSLLLQLVLIGGGVQIVMLGLVQWYSVRFYERVLETSIEIEIATIEPLLNAALSQLVFQRDYASTRAVLGNLVAVGSNLQYLNVYDAADRQFASVSAAPAAEQTAHAGQQPVVFDAAHNLWLGPENVGEIRFGLAPTRLIVLHEDLLYQSIGVSGLMVLLTIVLLSSLAYWLSRRIKNLLHCAEAIAGGDYTIRALVSGSDELARLARVFNRMIDALRTHTDALQRSEQRFRAIAEATPYALAIADWQDGRILYANAAVNELFRIEDDPCRHNIVEFWTDTDERRKIRDRIAGQGKALDCQLQLQRADGEVFWAICSGVALNWQEQNAFLAGFIDITERWLAAEQQRLMAKAFASTAEGIMIIDAGRQIQWTNQAFTTITGYLLSEMSGKTPKFLHAQQHDDAFDERIWQTLAASDYWQGEVWNRHRNGPVYPQWLRISSVRDDNGAVTHYVGVFTDITKLREHEARLAFLAYHDPLTGLANRTLFEQQLSAAIGRGERYRHNVGLLFIDLDGFKAINDSLGHPTGDRLLQAVAARLQTHIRKSDSLARFGGDEFVVLLSELNTPQAAAIAAQKILDILAGPFLIDPHTFHTTASIGIACYPMDGKDADTLLKNADIAMYRAKQIQGNYCIFYSAEMGARASERLAMINDLRLALEQHQFILHYQPRLNLSNGNITGFEALIRWQHPKRGMMAPGLFIPLAEETGLIIDIGDWVLKTACEQVRQWHIAGFERLCVAINLSAGLLRQGKLVPYLATVLAQTGVAASAIELEITETAAMHDPEETSKLLHELNAMGFAIAIDDFGTGYSSMSYLKRFPIDYLKIDRTFIKDLPDDKEDMAITRTIIALADSMNLQVIAEGVETEAQRAFLEREHCHEIQGYLIGRPIPAVEVEQLFASLRWRFAPIT